MDIDIINISNKIGRISDRFRRSLRDISECQYGNFEQIPLVYIKTNTQENFFLGFLPKQLHSTNFMDYQNFPQISLALLKNLFASIGVEYVPEVLIASLKEKSPFNLFEEFCLNFSSDALKVDAKELNRVILILKEMDGLRVEYPFNSKAIYLELTLLNFDKANRLIGQMEKVGSLFAELKLNNSELLIEAQKELLEHWSDNKRVDRFYADNGI